ncbi:membrane protein [Staphylococcus auricularis]|uniref:Integral membrane protein n=1 Tax=Staphylococcus auricularis TaxID=29379 RepID=A0AAP8TT73_9STAP|nr:YfhO family protein [Staphylococcus auricularis]PNZ67609.1 hypothetical protein CD158_05610 [Staphylococcus auricularis]QPT05478.1 YfhO family protein [Staphylococcus auricularis]BCU52134.1 membrane protein [Staphylococcus auricularis]SQJ10580.1 integral membrane protein [Staphylococcus auricularis]
MFRTVWAKIWSNKYLKFLCITLLSLLASLIIFIPYIYRYITEGTVFSGSGDGFRQMMPFQMYLYEHFTSFVSFYDHSFGLGGDYAKDLAYYYSTSPFTWLNFAGVWIAEHLFHANPHDITFWPTDQLIFSIVMISITFIISYYLFSYLRFKLPAVIIACVLYAGSTIGIYFNFTWSFYGQLVIFLPLSILGIERYFKERKIGLFIFAIALTLFSNFYFSYYQALVMLAYFVYRTIWPHPADIVNRLRKAGTIITAVMLSALSSILGFYTGVSSFFNNDRLSNPNYDIPPVTSFERQTHLFSNGFYITVTVIALVALFSFKLYKHYYYRLFAIMTWIMLVGALTPYFDSMFNGFSVPQKRWIYIFALSTAVLVALMIQHLAELSLKSYVLACLPALFIMIIANLFVTEEKLTWMIPCFILMIIIGFMLCEKSLFRETWTWVVLVGLFIVQQFVLLEDYHYNNLIKYESTRQAMDEADYRSPALQNKIDDIQSTHRDDPLSRIDYMSTYGLNSPMLYHFNGIALYSSIFDGHIMKYYDDLMQINMHTDKNSTYRLLSNRANLLALWNVQDRIREQPDDNQPYGFNEADQVNHGDSHTFIHEENTADYPAAHFTDRVYNSEDLKSPLDREQAMLQGVVLEDNKHANQTFKSNPNLKSVASVKLNDAHVTNNDYLKVTQNEGGVQYRLPKNIADQFEDLYVEMDLELLTPDKEHNVSVNEYTQERNKLTYKYRRFVTPVTYRVSADERLNLKLDKGLYRFKLKGIYGENYQTLKQASQEVDNVKVTQQDNGQYRITNLPHKDGYVVLPMAYRDGMKATSGGESLDVQRGNGVMTVVPVNADTSEIKLSYTPPHFWLLAILSLIGIILSMVFSWWIRRKSK